MANLFATAKALAPAATTAKAGTKHRKEMADLQTYAQLDAFIKAAEGMKKSLGSEINAEALKEFMRLGANGVRPDSFEGFEGNATASMELRKRSTASVLTSAEIDELKRLGLPVETIVTQTKMFGIAPKFTEDMDLLAKVSEKLEGLVPEGFFVVQEEIKKEVVGDATLAEAFAKKADEAVIRMITTSAIKPKLAVSDMAAILKAITPLLTGETEAEAATRALSK
jgi:hypothetical protein